MNNRLKEEALKLRQNLDAIYEAGKAAGGNGGTEIEITSTITNTQQLLNTLFVNIPTEHSCIAYVSSYRAPSYINNQVVFIYRICGVIGAVRFRNGAYGAFSAISLSDYDASVTIGDVYTVIDLGVL